VPHGLGREYLLPNHLPLRTLLRTYLWILFCLALYGALCLIQSSHTDECEKRRCAVSSMHPQLLRAGRYRYECICVQTPL
jgi:hypothetical protein